MQAMPPPEPPIPAEYIECVVESSAFYRVPPSIITTVLIVEGGAAGTISPNSNRTHDHGPMQLNTINLQKFIRFGISQSDITNNACINIAAGTMLLSEHLQNRPNNPWRAVGDYHSKTPVHHQRYMERIKKTYKNLLRKHANFISMMRSRVQERVAQGQNK